MARANYHTSLGLHIHASAIAKLKKATNTISNTLNPSCSTRSHDPHSNQSSGILSPRVLKYVTRVAVKTHNTDKKQNSVHWEAFDFLASFKLFPLMAAAFFNLPRSSNELLVETSLSRLSSLRPPPLETRSTRIH